MNSIATQARLQSSRAGIHINIKTPTLPVIPATFSVMAATFPVVPAQAGIQWPPAHLHGAQT